jgi:hypothetical protein
MADVEWVKRILLSLLLASSPASPADAFDRTPVDIRASEGDPILTRIAAEAKQAFANSPQFTVVERPEPNGVTVTLISQATILEAGRRVIHPFIEVHQNGRELPVVTRNCAPDQLADCASGIVLTTRNAVSGRPDLRNFPTFVRLERQPSFEPEWTTLFIGRFDGDPPGLFWFERERINPWKRTIAHHDYTTTDLCPGARAQVEALQQLQMPEPDVPGVEPDYTKLIMDGIGYSLAGHSRHADGQPGEFKIESNVGSPLAQWAELMLKSLQHCWKPVD